MVNKSVSRDTRVARLGKVKKAVLAAGLLISASAALLAQTNSGASLPARAGGALPGLTAEELTLFNAGKAQFLEVEDVTQGLGPRFNALNCAGCHAQPAVGGSSPAVNPQIAAASAGGARNNIPSFITLNGPVREARFKFVVETDGRIDTPQIRDGGVHDLFTVTGRSDAPGCSLTQPPFATVAAQNNLALRIPTPLFGAGLIEAITDSTIMANYRSHRRAKAALGISGRPNRNGNDGTITRLGWKAQNKSLTVFAGEAYTVEQGITNELFPNERDTENTPLPRECKKNATPEDHTKTELISQAGATFADVASNIVEFAIFMRFLTPPAPACDSFSNSSCPADIRRGRNTFEQIGCAECHTPQLAIDESSSAAITSQRTARLFSDLVLHSMGSGLADGIQQGLAGDDEFRTAPLWGLGQRLFFLHDGRTNNLDDSIQQHASRDSEANQVISNYRRLGASEKQELINFLRSL